MSCFDDAVALVLENEGNPPRGMGTKDLEDTFRYGYWKPANCDHLPWPICAAHLDAAVSLGVDAANVILQRAVGAVEDGNVGENTVMLVRTKSAPTVLNNMLVERMLHCAGTARDKPSELPNLPHWIIRCGNLRRALVKI